MNMMDKEKHRKGVQRLRTHSCTQHTHTQTYTHAHYVLPTNFCTHHCTHLLLKSVMGWKN